MTFESFIFYSQNMSINHYENFPVASILMPTHLKPAVVAIYTFARTADDIADEGDATPKQRFADLENYDQELNKIRTNADSEMKLFQSLGTIIRKHRLPISPFHDLISAFKQDVVTKRYQTYTDLLDYCRRSANPVGAIMLHLYQAASAQNLEESNAICSALQLTNFWQDIAVDWQKQRIYLPLDDLLRFNVTETQINSEIVDANWQRLMQFQIQRTRELMLSGSPLCKRLPGRIGWELRLVVQGGLRILERLEKVNGDIFQSRPKLELKDWIFVIWRALRM
jgi:squalene synthase HpnC